MVRTLLLSFLVMTACKKDAPRELSDDGKGVMAKMIADELPEIKQKLAAGKPEEAYYDCAQVGNLAEARASGKMKAELDEYEKLCTADVPAATIAARVTEIEAARKEKPDEKVLSACFDAKLDVAYKHLVEHKTLDAAKDALARYAVACPDQAAKLGQ